MHLKKNKAKGIAIDGIPIRKAAELFGIVNLVAFSPEDLNIIKNGPSERRRFMDLELCQLNKVYLQELTSYNKVLNQRNKLLKDIGFQPGLTETLDVWDMQLVSYGKKIIRQIHSNLTGKKEEIRLLYEPDVEEKVFEEKLQSAREKDLRFRVTSVGPHRDDFCVQTNGIDIRKYGSQGQQRTAALSLKMSEIYLVEKVTKDHPVLLLDDVLSELDSSRQNYLLQSIHNIQTVITCTGLDELIENNFSIDRVFRVTEGKIDF